MKARIQFALGTLLMAAVFVWSQSPSAHYRTHGLVQLNDLMATPGEVRPDATVAQLCDKDFRTATVRGVSESVKRQACAEYGIAPSDCTVKQGKPSKYEIDHLISLELGGSNDLKNLWPQPYLPKPGAKEKDEVENWLHAQVCPRNGQPARMSLAAAQRAIATDWYAVFLTVPKASGGGGR